ncbi:hypothetical protein GOP47_0014817 [Adiantum capillus-veneris]|uniref:Peptide deformylase n=1 Tax=Adiantum capillus-veneris TaxID=13818 RepID=A0A9D4UM93_ADICA|nr:hypothetical protein GOP47_0014817 [Adiantum capillus-veneris]
MGTEGYCGTDGFCVDEDEDDNGVLMGSVSTTMKIMTGAENAEVLACDFGVCSKLLQIIVLEDTKEYISYVSKEEADAQQRVPFDLLVLCNPVLKKLGTQKARFFEGCLSVEGYRGLVERHLEVEVSGFGQDGLPIKIRASGWQARILQHECDHLQGVLYVEKMVPKTFRTNENLRLPLPSGCPKPGVCSH